MLLLTSKLLKTLPGAETFPEKHVFKMIGLTQFHQNRFLPNFLIPFAYGWAMYK